MTNKNLEDIDFLYNEEEAKCPYCGDIQKECWETLLHEFDGNKIKIKCDTCEKEFYVFTATRRYYISEKFKGV